ncbi:MAG: YicC family protein [Clostridiales bacterium]|nr:YicC family protein [Clostridiales bacterium]
MIRSMTAYGRAKEQIGTKQILVEIKSVNSRYLDTQVKIARAYGYLEDKIKTYIKNQGLARGKIEIFVGIDVTASESAFVALDDIYTKSYINALKRLRDDYGLADDMTVMSIAANRDIFSVVKEDEDTEKEWADVKIVLDKALASFLAAREAEGERLMNDLVQKKAHLVCLTGEIAEKSAENLAAYRDKLEGRLKTILDDNNLKIDEQRILTECAIFADKVAIDEEIVRLHSHFKAFDEIFAGTEPVGRKLDFLLQEMNRETNTIGSKAQDAQIARLVIEMKNELEKIREQIQNLE